MSDIEVLTVGDTPSLVFAWRLQQTTDVRVSSAWSLRKHQQRKASITSEKFGSSHFLRPAEVFDIEALARVSPPRRDSKTNRRVSFDLSSVDPSDFLGDPLSQEYAPTEQASKDGYDFIIASVSSAQQLESIAASLSHVIIPHHTIILLDTSSGQSTLQLELQASLKDTPVIAWITDAPLCQSPTTRHPFQIIHSGQQTRTYFEPVDTFMFTFSHESRLSDMVASLNDVGLESTILASPARFIQLQWERAIPFVAFQPLSIIFDTPNLEKLSQNSSAMPIYQGIIQELVRIANGEGANLSSDFNSQYLVQNLNLNCITPTSSCISKSSSISSSSNSSVDSTASASVASTTSTSPSSFQHCDSPILYYNYFHSLPVPVDVLLRQPLLQAQRLSIKAPYLETVYAFMAQLINVEHSALFQKRVTSTTSIAPSSSPLGPGPNGAAPGPKHLQHPHNPQHPQHPQLPHPLQQQQQQEACGGGPFGHLRQGPQPASHSSFSSSSSSFPSPSHIARRSLLTSSNPPPRGTAVNPSMPYYDSASSSSGTSLEDDAQQSSSSTSAAHSPPSSSSSTSEQQMLKTLQSRESVLAKREQALIAREQELLHQYQKRPHVPHSTQSMPPPPKNHVRPISTQPPPQQQRPRSAVPPQRPSMHPPSSSSDFELDMMSLTARRSRRSISSKKPVTMSAQHYNSQQQAQQPQQPHAPPLRSYTSNPHLTTQQQRMQGYQRPPPPPSNNGSQPWSQKFDLGDVAEFTSSRYGAMSINSRRLSAASITSATSSRANSITSSVHFPSNNTLNRAYSTTNIMYGGASSSSTSPSTTTQHPPPPSTSGNGYPLPPPQAAPRHRHGSPTSVPRAPLGSGAPPPNVQPVSTAVHR